MRAALITRPLYSLFEVAGERLDAPTKRALRLVNKRIADKTREYVTAVSYIRDKPALSHIEADPTRWPFFNAKNVYIQNFVSDSMVKALASSTMHNLSIGSLRCSPEALPALAAADWPALQSLTLNIEGVSQWNLDFMKNGKFGRLTKLDIISSLHLPPPTDLTGLDALPNLTALYFTMEPPSADYASTMLQSLKKCSSLAALAILGLNVIGETATISRGLLTALSGIDFPALQSLLLQGHVFMDISDTQALAAWHTLPRLRTLRISAVPKFHQVSGYFDHEHLAMILQGCRGGDLRSLILDFNPA